MNMYIPEWLGVMELNLGNAWRAVWNGREEIPPEAPLLYGYVVVICDDKGYVTRPAGDTRWGVAEGTIAADEQPAAFVKRIALEQTGAQGGKPELIGFFECKATSHNPDFPVGYAGVRPIYLLVAAKMKDIGRGSGFERRRLPLNEFVAALRAGYPELNDHVPEAVDRYLVTKAKAAVSR
jgi:hypothetical protein